MHLITSLLASAVAAQVAPASAAKVEDELPVYAQVKGWTILKMAESDSCVLQGEFERGSLSMHWRPRKKSLGLFAYFNNYTSIKEDQEYKVKVYFVRGNDLDDGWGERSAYGFESTTGTKGLSIILPGEVALSDIAKNDHLAFEFKGDPIGSFNLSNSAAAIAEVRRCARDILSAHPIDPFED